MDLDYILRANKFKAKKPGIYKFKLKFLKHLKDMSKFFYNYSINSFSKLRLIITFLYFQSFKDILFIILAL